MSELHPFVWRFLKWCYSLDEVVDDSVAKRAKKVFAKNADVSSILTIFLEYFDKLFRPSSMLRPHFRQCAGVSCIVFAIIASLYVLFSALLFPDHLNGTISGILYAKNDWLLPKTLDEAIWEMLIFLVAVNIIGDFLSIWETRYVLQKLLTARTIFSQMGWWMLDILTSVGIFVFSMAVGFVVYAIPNLSNVEAAEWSWLFSNMPGMVFGILFETMTFSNKGTWTVLSVCFYTTMTTTLWASLSIAITKSWSWLRIFGGLLRAQSYPFGALTACVLASLIAVAAVLSCVVRALA